LLSYIFHFGDYVPFLFHNFIDEQNKTNQNVSGFCPTIFDGWSCVNATASGSLAVFPCPRFAHLNFHHESKPPLAGSGNDQIQRETGRKKERKKEKDSDSDSIETRSAVFLAI
jgi:hypothetical protein